MTADRRLTGSLKRIITWLTPSWLTPHHTLFPSPCLTGGLWSHPAPVPPLNRKHTAARRRRRHCCSCLVSKDYRCVESGRVCAAAAAAADSVGVLMTAVCYSAQIITEPRSPPAYQRHRLGALHTRTYARTHARTHGREQASTPARAHTHAHTHTHTHTHAHTEGNKQAHQHLRTHTWKISTQAHARTHRRTHAEFSNQSGLICS